jgi:hypothetical protein
MKKALTALASCLMAVGMVMTSAIGAEAAGFQTKDFTVTNGNYTAFARVVIYRLDSNTFRLRNQNEGWGWSYTTSDGSEFGGFRMNAICLDYEDTPGHYTQYVCTHAPSTTLDDVPTNLNQPFINAGYVDFNTSDSPALRFRFYGVGPGPIENRFDDYVAFGAAP